MIELLAAFAFGWVIATAVSPPAPVATPCTEAVAARPDMPTEAMRPGVAPDVFVRGVIAEIELREAYELRLRTALENCTRS